MTAHWSGPMKYSEAGISAYQLKPISNKMTLKCTESLSKKFRLNHRLSKLKSIDCQIAKPSGGASESDMARSPCQCQ